MKNFTFVLIALLSAAFMTSCSTQGTAEAKTIAVEFLKTAGKAAAIEAADASLQVFDIKIAELEGQLAAYQASLPQPVSVQDSLKLSGYKAAIKAAKQARTAAAEKLLKLREMPAPPTEPEPLPTVVVSGK